MDSARQTHIRGYHFYRKEALRTRWDLNSAIRFLSRFKDDAGAMASLRQFASQENTKPVSDAQLFKHVAQMLTSGQLVVAMPRDRMQAPPSLGLTPKPAVATQPPPLGTSEPPEDDPTFTNNDAAKQAAVLKTAAARRVPFCEECDRQAKRREAA